MNKRQLFCLWDQMLQLPGLLTLYSFISHYFNYLFICFPIFFCFRWSHEFSGVNRDAKVCFENLQLSSSYIGNDYTVHVDFKLVIECRPLSVIQEQQLKNKEKLTCDTMRNWWILHYRNMLLQFNVAIHSESIEVFYACFHHNNYFCWIGAPKWP